MRLAFDARAWESPPNSFRRVLRLLYEAAQSMGWEVELWIEGSLQPEFQQFNKLTYLAAEAAKTSRAKALWSPQLEIFPAAVPTVSMVHDINPLLPDGRAFPVRWWREHRFRSRVKGAFNSAWRLATGTDDARGRISSEFPAVAKKLKVVPYYADPDLRPLNNAQRDNLLSSLGLSSGFILFLGSLRRHKNWDGLLRAYAALPESLRKAHPLVLAGPAHRALDKAKRLAALLQVRDQVYITGTVSEEMIPALYSGAFLFVFPSFFEGFGLPPLEAMACGVPVIATDRTSVPEVLGDGPVYINPADLTSITQAMETLIENRDQRESLIQAGFNRVASFGPERTGKAMQELLDEL